jgi:hypothetical protein
MTQAVTEAVEYGRGAHEAFAPPLLHKKRNRQKQNKNKKKKIKKEK